jgi:hypothetical protein
MDRDHRQVGELDLGGHPRPDRVDWDDSSRLFVAAHTVTHSAPSPWRSLMTRPSSGTVARVALGRGIDLSDGGVDGWGDLALHRCRGDLPESASPTSKLSGISPRPNVETPEASARAQRERWAGPRGIVAAAPVVRAGRTRLGHARPSRPNVESVVGSATRPLMFAPRGRRIPALAVRPFTRSPPSQQVRPGPAGAEPQNAAT